MSQPRRVIAPLADEVGLPWEERLWLTNAALLLLGGAAASTILWNAPLDGPLDWRNGWILLTTLAASLFVLLIGVNLFSPRGVRRLQFATLLSLLFHLGIGVLLGTALLPLWVAPEEEVANALPLEEVPVPEYVEAPQLTESKVYEMPVEANVEESVEPSPVRSNAQVVQQETAKNVDERVEVLSGQATRPNRAIPRRERSQARPSRQVAAAQSRARAAPALTDSSTNVNDASQSLSSSDSGAARSTPALPDLESRPTESTSAIATALPNRERQEERPQVTPQDAISRQSELAELAQDAIEQDVNSTPAEAVAASELTATTDSTRSEAEVAISSIDRPLPEEVRPNVEEAEITPRETIAAATPTIEPIDLPTRQDAVRPQSRSVEAESLVTAESALAESTSSLQAADEATPRSSANLVTAIENMETSRSTDSESNQIAARQRSESRETRPAQVSTNSPQAPSRRSAQASLTQAAPSVAESTTPVAVQGENPLIPSASSALSRAEQGRLGGDVGLNQAVGERANPRRVAANPSSAARRPAASQTEAGPSLSPSAPARIAKAIAEADAPTASIETQPIEIAEASGANRPVELDASSSAAVERQASNVATGDIAASIGETRADTGVEQIVPDTATGRAGGGGQPEIELTTPIVGRSNLRAGAPSASLQAAELAAQPTDTSGQSNSTSNELASAPAANTARSRQGRIQLSTSSSRTSAIDDNAASNQIASASPARGSGQNRSAELTATYAPARATPVAPATIAGSANTRVPETSPSGTVPSAASQPSTSVAAVNRGTSRAGNSAALPSREVAGPRRSHDSRPNVAMNTGSSRSRPSATPGSTQPTEGPRIARAPTAAATPSGGAVPLPNEEKSRDFRGGESGAHEGTAVAMAGDTNSTDRSRSTISISSARELTSGGVGRSEPPIRSGVPDRRADPRSPVTLSAPARLARREPGTAAALATTARATAPAFAQRRQRSKSGSRGRSGQLSAKTEAAIELGLVYLARHQRSDGRWSLDRNGVDLKRAPRERPALKADTAATGLALLALLGAGYDHYDDKYQDVVFRGLHFLVENQQESGNLYIEEDAQSNRSNQFYSHGIAAIALCEAYGMTGDPSLEDPAQRALDYIVESQHPEHGGWRYEPGAQAFSSDLSVTGWQVMALRSGDLAGLQVPNSAYVRARQFVQKCRAGSPRRGLFVYNPTPAGSAAQQHYTQPSTVMTSVGLATDLYLGGDRTTTLAKDSAQHLLDHLPTIGGRGTSVPTGTLSNPLRDTYYWYYGTQAMFHMQGEYWQAWHSALHELLINSQSREGRLAGSWNPFEPNRDHWAPHAGRIYVTSMNLLSLEVVYRHLPLYDIVAK